MNPLGIHCNFISGMVSVSGVRNENLRICPLRVGGVADPCRAEIFASILAALLTLALFGYEVRGIRRSDHLITEGMHLEQQLGITHGQFHVCESEHSNAKRLSRVFN